MEAAGQSVTRKEEDLPVTPLRSVETSSRAAHGLRVTHGKLFLKTDRKDTQRTEGNGCLEGAMWSLRMTPGTAAGRTPHAVLPQDLALSVAVYRQCSAFT